MVLLLLEPVHVQELIVHNDAFDCTLASKDHLADVLRYLHLPEDSPDELSRGDGIAFLVDLLQELVEG